MSEPNVATAAPPRPTWGVLPVERVHTNSGMVSAPTVVHLSRLTIKRLQVRESFLPLGFESTRLVGPLLQCRVGWGA